MPMPNRNVEGNYRYGYQGQYAEKEPELGSGINSFELRLWDSRIGRWLSPDPYGQYHSPYLGMGNNPIRNVDPDGGFTCDTPPCPESALGTEARFNFLSGVWDDFSGHTLSEVVVFGGSGNAGNGNDFISLAGASIGLQISGVGTSLYSNQIDKIISNKNSFVTIYEPVKLNDITTFRQQNIDEYIEAASRKHSIRVVDTELRGSIKQLAKAVRGAGYLGGGLGFLISIDQYNNDEISGGILALDGVMTVVGFTGVGTIPSVFYFVVIRNDSDRYESIESLDEAMTIKRDNTRVHLNTHKVYNIKFKN